MFFACASVSAILVGSQALIAQIKNIYNEDSDQIAGLNSLMSAVAANDISGVRFFSKAGGSLINQKNIGGATALHIAAREKNLDITQMLIDNGADVNVADNEGWTPLMRATMAGSSDIVELLLNKNADATALNSVGESVIIHATISNCNECLDLMFEKFNFIKAMDDSSLRSQLQDAFTIARNHENEEIQATLEKYLDQVVKLSNLVKPQLIVEDIGEKDISIIEDNKLNLVTKNKGNSKFEEKNLSADNNHIKGKFKFTGDASGIASSQAEDDTVYIIDNNKPLKSKSGITDKRNKFVLIVGASKSDPKATTDVITKTFKPSDSNAVFLKNSKVDDTSITDILKSRKFRFSQGPKSTEVVKNNFKIEGAKSEEPKALKTQPENKSEETAPIPPIVNSFKLLKGPVGKKDEQQKTDQGEDITNNSKAVPAFIFKKESEISSYGSMPLVPEKITAKKESAEINKADFKLSKGKTPAFKISDDAKDIIIEKKSFKLKKGEATKSESDNSNDEMH